MFKRNRNENADTKALPQGSAFSQGTQTKVLPEEGGTKHFRQQTKKRLRLLGVFRARGELQIPQAGLRQVLRKNYRTQDLPRALRRKHPHHSMKADHSIGLRSFYILSGDFMPRSCKPFWRTIPTDFASARL